MNSIMTRWHTWRNQPHLHPFSRFQSGFRRADLSLWLYSVLFSLAACLCEVIRWLELNQLGSTPNIHGWAVLLVATLFVMLINLVTIFPTAQRRRKGLLWLSIMPLFCDLALSGPQADQPMRKGSPLGLHITRLSRRFGTIPIATATHLNLAWFLVMLASMVLLDVESLEFVSWFFRVMTAFTFIAFLTVSWRTWPTPAYRWRVLILAPLLVDHFLSPLVFFALCVWCFPTRTGSTNPVMTRPVRAFRPKPRMNKRLATPFRLKQGLVFWEAAALCFMPLPVVILTVVLWLWAAVVTLGALQVRKPSFGPWRDTVVALGLAMLGVVMALSIHQPTTLTWLVSTGCFLAFLRHLGGFQSALIQGRFTSWAAKVVVLFIALLATKVLRAPSVLEQATLVFQVLTITVFSCGPLLPFAFRAFRPVASTRPWDRRALTLYIPLGGLLSGVQDHLDSFALESLQRRWFAANAGSAPGGST